MFGSLLNMLDKRTVGDVANALGQPEQSVQRGMESSIAAVLGGLSSKAGDTGALRRILDTVSSTAGSVSWSQIASSVADPNSSLMAAGKRILPALFGTSEQTVTGAISRESGLSSGAIATLLSMAAPVVMSFLSRQIRDGGLTLSSLGSILQKESGAIRNALPAGLSELFWPGTAATHTATASPVIAQAVHREKSFNWLPVLAICALGLGLLWFLSHARRPVTPGVALGTASRMATPPPATRSCTVPSSLNIPRGSSFERFATYVQNPDAKPSSTTWFDLDAMEFTTGSAKLRPESQSQINNIATIMNNCPNVSLLIAGFTDNVGNADANMNLSQNRANAVVAQLVNKGVPADRLAAKGYGEDNPIADNSTEEGRARNRRASMQITNK
jgi:outer membrane protein OmpA-like peptidoglycan-associated protein